jgi:hypothetical protein
MSKEKTVINLNAEYTKTLEEKFLRILEVKTSWGRNEIKEAFKTARAEAAEELLIKRIGEDVPF